MVASASDKPFEVKALEDYISDWKEVGYSSYLLTLKNNLHFNKLFIQSHFAALEKIIEFSGIIELVSKDLMKEDYKDLYTLLVGLGCELSFKGLLRDPSFKNELALTFFQKYIPDLKVSNDLINALNESEHAMKLIKGIHLDKLAIYVHPFMPLSSTTNAKSMLIDLSMNYFYNPVEINWVVKVNKLYSTNPYFSRISSYKKDFIKILQLIEFISQIILKISHSYAERLDLYLQ